MNLIQILTNENPILINVLAFIFAGIEGVLFYYLISTIFSIEYRQKNKFIFVSTICFTGGLANILDNNLLKDIINIVPFLLLMHLLFHQNTKNTLISLICSYFILIVSEFVSESLLSLLLKCTLNDIAKIPLYYMLGMLFAGIVYYIVIVSIKYIKAKRIIIHFNIPLRTTIALNVVLGMIPMSLEAYLLSKYTDSIPFELSLIIMSTLFIYFSFSMYSIIRTTTLEKTKADLENEILYNKTLTVLHDNIRSFKHDFNNIVQSLGGYIDFGDIEGLKDFYNHLLEECQLNNNLNLLNPQTINNPSIYSLLTSKYYTALEKDIHINFSVFTDLSKINFNNYELTRILGILLDNAIEAAEETKEKIVDVEFLSDNKKQLFIIKNSCLDSNISTTKIFEKGYSTKKRNSGIGLWKVHKILSKNTNLDLYTTVKENIFSQQLEVYFDK